MPYLEQEPAELVAENAVNKSQAQMNAELSKIIPDICHFFYTSTFQDLKILHSKVRKFTTKTISRQNSVN